MSVSAKATPAYLGRVARDLTQRVDPAATRKREARAKAGRSVRLELGADGMAWLTAHLPAAAAIAAYEHLDALAHTLPTDPDGMAEGAPTPGRWTPNGPTSSPASCSAPASPPTAPSARRHRSTSMSSSTAAKAPAPTSADLPGEIARLGPVTTDTLRDLLDLADAHRRHPRRRCRHRPDLPRCRRPRGRGTRPLRPTREAQEPAPRPAPHLCLPRLRPPLTPLRARPHHPPPRGPYLRLQPSPAVQAPPQPQTPRPRLAPSPTTATADSPGPPPPDDASTSAKAPRHRASERHRPTTSPRPSTARDVVAPCAQREATATCARVH